MAQIKTKKEIAYITKACRITDEIFSTLIKKWDFKTEREVYLWLVREIKRRGLRSAFPPIVSSGERAGNEIHPKSTKAHLSGFVIIDFGVRVNGYCSDMTRTIYIGTPSKKERAYYEKILKAFRVGCDYVQDTLPVAVSDAKARKFLGGDKKYFIHMLGHGVGKRIHERPRLYFKSPDIFMNNMVVTVEPGIYIPGKLGIRIEDTLLVSGKKPLSLTKSPLSLICIK